VAIVAVMVISGRALTSADIRLDSGDLRYRYFGIPIVYERMPEPQRARLLALTSGSSVCRNVWCPCAVFPLPTSNNTDAMCRGFYMKMDAWIDVDRTLARAGIEDVGRYVIDTGVRQGLPRSFPLMRPVELGKGGRMRVRSDWREDEGVQLYRESVAATRPAK
jgi:hypothetical protein